MNIQLFNLLIETDLIYCIEDPQNLDGHPSFTIHFLNGKKIKIDISPFDLYCLTNSISKLRTEEYIKFMYQSEIKDKYLEKALKIVNDAHAFVCAHKIQSSSTPAYNPGPNIFVKCH